MRSVLPYFPFFLAGILGVVVVAWFGQEENIEYFAIFFVVAGALSGIISAFGTKVIAQLTSMAEINGLHPFVERRLIERVNVRRRRFARKQLITTICAVVTASLGGLLLKSSGGLWMLWIACPSALIAATGVLLFWSESVKLTECVSDLKRYVACSEKNKQVANEISGRCSHSA